MVLKVGFFGARRKQRLLDINMVMTPADSGKPRFV
jgi:hypothetical protein